MKILNNIAEEMLILMCKNNVLVKYTLLTAM